MNPIKRFIFYLFFLSLSFPLIAISNPITFDKYGAIIRGSKNHKKIALEFTGHEYAEGGSVILNELAKHHAKASFFLTGDFLTNPKFKPLIQRMILEGHYIGPHSDKHLLYCAWENRKKTLITRQQFIDDLNKNLYKLSLMGIKSHYWLPSYEWHNKDITRWSAAMGMVLVDFTPGTLSDADYTEDKDIHFVSSQAILKSILKREQEDPNGLNGFLLLMHIGSGPGRSDKMYLQLGKLLDILTCRAYQFVRIDELIKTK